MSEYKFSMLDQADLIRQSIGDIESTLCDVNDTLKELVKVLQEINRNKTMTLGEYLKLTAVLFGEGSPPHTFIADKIRTNPDGADDKVIADETQMMALFAILMEKPK